MLYQCHSCGHVGEFHESLRLTIPALRLAIPALIKLLEHGDKEVLSSIVDLVLDLAKRSEWQPYTI
jgi:hypothetical protein